MVNLMKDSVAIMDDIMDRVSQTEVWNAIQSADPLIKDAEAELTRNLDALDGIISDKQIEDLRAAAWGLANATDYPAILYGMRVAQAIQDVTFNPAALSQCILDRVRKCRGIIHAVAA